MPAANGKGYHAPIQVCDRLHGGPLAVLLRVVRQKVAQSGRGEPLIRFRFRGQSGRDAMFAKELSLHSARTLAPLRLPEIALARVRPSARVAAEDVTQFADYFSPNSLAPARKGLACRPSRAFLLPSSAHHGNLKGVGPVGFRLCLCHAASVGGRLLKARCLLGRNAAIPTRGDILGRRTFGAH
jgi:hypothetical protein